MSLHPGTSATPLEHISKASSIDIATVKTEIEDGTAASKKASQPGRAPPYTTFTRAQLRLLTLLLGLATITSPLTATIYLPLLPLLRDHFRTSAQAINLTLTIYIVFQALSPAIFGPLSDNGRRPMYLLSILIYCAGNLGLALNTSSYAALLVLRALQSLGASASFAIIYGVVADVCVPSRRGSMMGPVSMALNVGTCVGPVVGGWIAYRSGSYRWVFWVLVIIGGVLLLAVGSFLPETARSVVGNGSFRGAKWYDESILSLVSKRVFHEQKEDTEKVKHLEVPAKSKESYWKRIRFTNPLACLRIIFHADTALCLWVHGSFYVVDYSVVAALPDIYANVYGLNELQIGLAYLPRGTGIIVGGYCNGRFMDYNYKAIAKQIGWTIDDVGGDDLTNFPIERARSRGSIWLLGFSTALFIGYGWIIQNHVHLAVPLVLQFFQGFIGTTFYTTYSTLLMDIFPEKPSTAAAAASIVRCAMASTGVALLQPLLDALGRAWYFTILGIWSGVCGAIAVLLIRSRGMKWRQKRNS